MTKLEEQVPVGCWLVLVLFLVLIVSLLVWGIVAVWQGILD